MKTQAHFIIWEHPLSLTHKPAQIGLHPGAFHEILKVYV